MATELQVKISSQANLDAFSRATQAVDRLIGRVLGMNGALQGLRSQLAALAAGAAGLHQLRAAYQEAVKAEQALAQWRRALESAGLASAGLQQQLLAQAEALQRLTGVEDETVLTVQRLLVSYGATGEQVARLAPLVLDLAANMGIEATSAARMLGQALDGQATGLARLNITARSFDSLLPQLTRAVGGQAEALFRASGGAGAYATSLSQAREALGQAIKPEIDSLLHSLARAFTALKEVVADPRFREALDYFKGFVLAAGLTAGIATLIPLVRNLRLEIATLAWVLQQSNLATTLSTAFTSAQVAALKLNLAIGATVAAVWTLVEAGRALRAEFSLAEAEQTFGAVQERLRTATLRALSDLELRGGEIAEKARQIRAEIEAAWAAGKPGTGRDPWTGQARFEIVPDVQARERALRDATAFLKAHTAAEREAAAAAEQHAAAQRRLWFENRWWDLRRGISAVAEVTSDAWRRTSQWLAARQEDIARWRESTAAMTEYRRGVEQIAEAMEAEAQARRNAEIAERAAAEQSAARIQAQQLEQERARFHLSTFGGQLGSQTLALLQQLGTAAQNAAAIVTGTLGTAFRAISDQITQLILGTVSWGQALANIGRAIISQLVASIVNFFVTLAARAALSALFGAAIAKAAAAASAAAWAGPALLASTATFGSAPAVGTAALLGSLAAAPAISAAATFAGGFAEGGLVPPGERIIRVNERGPEFVVNAPATARYLPLLEAINSQPASPASRTAIAQSPGESPLRVVIVDSRRDADELLRDPRWRTALVDLSRQFA